MSQYQENEINMKEEYRNIQQKAKKSLIVTRQRHENDRLKTLLYLQSGKLRSQQFYFSSIFFEKYLL